MKKAATVLITALLILFVIVSCGNDPFFHKVTFDTAGGSEVATQIVRNGEKAEKPDDPTRKGYTFVRWATEKDGETEFEFSTEITGDMTLYAVWKVDDGSGSDTPTPTPTPAPTPTPTPTPTPAAKTINITYDLNGGKMPDGKTNPATATEGDSVTLEAATKDTTSGTETNYSIDDTLVCDSASVTRIYTFKGWKVEGADDSTAATSYTAGDSDVKLVAVWDSTATASDYAGVKLKSTVSTTSTFLWGNIPSGTPYYNGDQEIRWKVIKVENGRALVISDQVLTKGMNNANSNSYSWKNSPIYDWLNKSGTDGFLSKYGLTELSLANVSHITEKSNYVEQITSDEKVFLLSKTEVNDNLTDKTAQSPTEGYVSWILRTPGSDSEQCSIDC